MSLSVMSPAASSRTLILTSSVELLERVGDGAQRARHVGLEDDPQLLGLAGLDLLVEVLEGRAAPALARLGGRRVLAALDLRAGGHHVVHDAQDVAGLGDVGEAEDDHGARGPGLRDPLAGEFSRALILPNVLPATMMSPTRSVPVWTRASRPAPRPLSSRASMIVPTASRFGLALSSWRSATSRMISISSSMPWPRLRRHRDQRRVAAVLLDDDAGLGELGLDAVRVRRPACRPC